ncbi:Transcriptional regulator [Gordonia sp. KTR9]|nr:Transcriptional regulator [Gordonia sp. KTR9]
MFLLGPWRHRRAPECSPGWRTVLHARTTGRHWSEPNRTSTPCSRRRRVSFATGYCAYTTPCPGDGAEAVRASQATPAPATSTIAGGTLPAAVTWPANNLPKTWAASTTASYPRLSRSGSAHPSTGARDAKHRVHGQGCHCPPFNHLEPVRIEGLGPASRSRRCRHLARDLIRLRGIDQHDNSRVPHLSRCHLCCRAVGIFGEAGPHRTARSPYSPVR